MTARQIGFGGVVHTFRRARKALDRGDREMALLLIVDGSQALGNAVGNLERYLPDPPARPGTAVPAMLRKIRTALVDRLMRAMREAPPAPAFDVAAVVVECLEVLRTRDGLDVDEALVRERAANISMALCGLFDIRVAPPVVEKNRPSLCAF